ncbi:molecular chaperone HscC [Roseateles asaccharophilus]|uniref:Molecular chaperone HscC n=1 Tax=Roseateles asaccharophilus TaxID=582607 RepID=A0ABU2A626_9BURK|nr:molecular chaperone HscC [Roseateles asaccharophilus]MDR7332644.1 molecular chaperone HscC [Roseateles asaccharophilus]
MILGIDLGTTHSAAAVFRDGAAVLIPNAHGDYLTPSAVALDEQGHTLVGLAARERAGLHAQSTALAFKRWMGSDRKITLRTGPHVKELRAEELSALVLQTLKSDAEAFLGEPVTEAVITVPAYFNEAQRRATRTAGEIAGLKVERLLNEPTAAGLAYGLQERPEHSSFLVFDLGGGTFDVSVLEYFDGVVEVRASAGDTRLGGEDFSRAIAQLFAKTAEGLSAEERTAWFEGETWWRMAEQAKRDLGERDSAELRSVWRDRTLTATITRADFEAGAQELLQRLRRPIERALADAQLNPAGLAEVVLVGGATRMPMVRQLVARLFQRLPLRNLDPDLAIAMGAAVQAGLKARDAALDDVVLTDVMPYSLGIVAATHIAGRMVNDRFSPIIERNTPVPVSRVESYHTLADGQRQILVDVRQGESPVGSENLHLGKLEIEVTPAPAGQAGVEVRFTYDANGLLEVEARETPGGQRHELIIESQGARLSAAEIAATRERLQSLKRHPRDEQDNRYQIERAKRLFEDRLGNDRQMLQDWLGQFELALQTQDPRVIRTARQQFKEALDSIDTSFRF